MLTLFQCIISLPFCALGWLDKDPQLLLPYLVGSGVEGKGLSAMGVCRLWFLSCSPCYPCCQLPILLYHSLLSYLFLHMLSWWLGKEGLKMIEGYLFLMSRPNCSHIFSFEHSKKRNGLGRSEKWRWKKIEANSWWGYLCLKTAQASPRCSGALSSEWMQLFTEKCLIQYGNSLDTCKFMLSRQSIHCKRRRCAT